jgi:hypothetical protein
VAFVIIIIIIIMRFPFNGHPSSTIRLIIATVLIFLELGIRLIVVIFFAWVLVGGIITSTSTSRACLVVTSSNPFCTGGFCKPSSGQ